MQRNLGSLDRATRLMLGLFALLAAAILFTDPFARVFAFGLGIYLVWECTAGKCPLNAALGVRSPADVLGDEKLRLLGLAAVQAVIAYAWWTAGWEKVVDGAFVPGMAKTLAAFAARNPFPWYKAFLLGPATTLSGLFGLAVEYGELAAGAALGIAAAVVLLSKSRMSVDAGYRASIAALAVGMLMNANFYFAAGWTGAGTKGDNIVMFWVSAALLYVWAASLRRSAPPGGPKP